MSDWEKCLVKPNLKVIEAIEVLYKSRTRLLMVLDDNKKLSGIVSDGDIRHALLNGKTMESTLSEFYNQTPVTLDENYSKEEVVNVLQNEIIQRVPVLDSEGKVIDVIFREAYKDRGRHENPVVIMAGGLGSRLSPLTDDIPKPMLKVGDHPILETIIRACAAQGFYRFFIAVNYKSEVIKDYFGDGLRWNVEITYLEEKEKLATAGALSLLNCSNEHPALVLNGDLLTKVSLSDLLEFHKGQKSDATMCVKQFDIQIPYGVVTTKESEIMEIQEKPTQNYLIAAGIYVVNKLNLHKIPKNQACEMPDFLRNIKKEGGKVCAFPIHEYWLDIGQMKDFEQAQVDVKKIF